MQSINDKAFSRASGFFLTEPFPENWAMLSAKELLEFIKDHTCEDFEDWDEEIVLASIQELASTLIFFAQDIKENLND